MSDLLRILIESALQDGEISPADYEIIKKKAQDTGLSQQQLDALIEQIKNEKKENNELNMMESGFISFDEEPTKQEKQPEEQSEFTNITPLKLQGAMSSVFKAKKYGKWIIIKRIKPEFKNNPKYKQLFIREFENGYHLDHPNIVRILDKGEDKDGLYFTMEYIDGRPLRDMITKNGIENDKLAEKIIRQTLDALSYVHKKQIFHRDLKPENIFITYRGDNVKILDFGLAAADYFEDDLVKVGTPAYAAPEQLKQGNKIDQRADIYAVGKIFLELLTGSRDFKDLKKINNPHYKAVIEKALHENPNQRFNSADDMLDALNNPSFGIHDQTKNITTLPESKPQKLKKSSFTKILLFSGLGIILLALALFFILKNKNFVRNSNNNIISKADSLYKAGEYIAALKEYQKIEKKDDDINQKIEKLLKINTAYNSALEAEKNKNIAKAVSIIDSLLKENPEFVEAKQKKQQLQKLIDNVRLFDLNIEKSAATEKYGLIDPNGNIIVNFSFDYIAPKKDWHKKGIIPVKCNGKWGFIGPDKTLFAPCIYDGDINGKYVWINNGFRVKKNGKRIYITVKDGKGVVSE